MAPRKNPQKRSEMVGICRGEDLGPDMPSFPCGMPRRLPLCHTPLGANVPSSRAPGLRRLRGGAPSAYGLRLDGLVVYLMLPLFALCAYAVVGAASYLLTFLVRASVAMSAKSLYEKSSSAHQALPRAAMNAASGLSALCRAWNDLSALYQAFFTSPRRRRHARLTCGMARRDSCDSR